MRGFPHRWVVDRLDIWDLDLKLTGGNAGSNTAAIKLIVITSVITVAKKA
jgi:hypothetical protein